MRNKFKVQAPEIKNNFFYLVLVGTFLFWVEWRGKESWDSWTQSFTPFTLFVGFGFGFYFVIFWMAGLFYLFVDLTQRPEWIYKHKIQENCDPLKLRKMRPSLASTVNAVFMNQFFGTLPAVILVYYILDWRRGTLVDAVPSCVTILMHLFGIILFEEVGFYFCHLILHQPLLFRKIHRVHHEYQEPIGLATHYVHYLEHWFGNLFPIFLGPIVLGSHPIVLFLWVAIAVINAVHTHSNYHFKWMSYSVFHDFHHWNFKGNYGVLGLLDLIFKTDASFKKLVRSSSSKH